MRKSDKIYYDAIMNTEGTELDIKVPSEIPPKGVEFSESITVSNEESLVLIRFSGIICHFQDFLLSSGEIDQIYIKNLNISLKGVYRKKDKSRCKLREFHFDLMDYLIKNTFRVNLIE